MDSKQPVLPSPTPSSWSPYEPSGNRAYRRSLKRRVGKCHYCDAKQATMAANDSQHFDLLRSVGWCRDRLFDKDPRGRWVLACPMCKPTVMAKVREGEVKREGA